MRLVRAVPLPETLVKAGAAAEQPSCPAAVSGDRRLPLSAGWYSSRLAWLERRSFLCASDNAVYVVQVEGNRQVARGDSEPFAPAPPQPYLLPTETVTARWTRLDQPRLRSEIQCLACAPCHLTTESSLWLLSAVDAHGTAVVSRLHRDVADSGQRCWNVRSGYTVPPVDPVDAVASGAACALLVDDARSSAPLLAVMRHLPNAVSLYDGELPLRTWHTVEHPTSVAFWPGDIGLHDTGATGHMNSHAPLLFLTEGAYLTVLDLRASAAAMRRKPLASVPAATGGRSGCLYGCAVNEDAVAVAAGAERTVLAVDYRTWRVRGRWPTCLRQDATTVLLPRRAPDAAAKTWRGCCFVSGIDNEMAFGRWDAIAPTPRGGDTTITAPHVMLSGSRPLSSQRLFGFRADERWLGACLMGDTHWAGVSESGAVYLLELE
ncbi:hypothetical protein CDCA_CDCA02G0540 [Cyanidium caldarium]|uniref:Uncharacterized protein n=1 Tax=Cyanidium caldarium TaxID=2771 RepID=A0AAV9IQE2_CYACA|nr:hypothetical protein CDCA_CDCA02G0540 [Cyanidium caldarium]